MNYQGAIFRPPSEADSLLLQVTVGCSHNRCAFCSMYREKSFRIKPFEGVVQDLAEARGWGPVTRRVFLCDGDALILPTDRLLRILEAIREQLPWIERVACYGDPRSVHHKSVPELQALRNAGLTLVYHGLESGDDEVLTRMDKGANRAESLELADLLRAARIGHSVIVLLGLGGVERSEEHIRQTASALTEMSPAYVGALTLTVVPGTPLAEWQAAGRFHLPDPFGFLTELRLLLAESNLRDCLFSSNHASNYLPLRGRLPAERDRLVELLDRVLRSRDPRVLRPEAWRGL